MRNLLIVQTGSLADLVLTTALRRELPERFPGTPRSVLTTPAGAAIGEVLAS